MSATRSTGVRSHMRDGRRVRSHTREIPWMDRVLSATRSTAAGGDLHVGLKALALGSGLTLVWTLNAFIGLTLAVMVGLATVCFSIIGLSVAKKKRSGRPVRSRRTRPTSLSPQRRYRLWKHKMRKKYSPSYRYKVWSGRMKKKYSPRRRLADWIRPKEVRRRFSAER